MIGRLCLAAVAALVTSMTMIDAPSAREITYEISADAFYFYFGENIGSVDFKFQVNTEDIQEFDGNLSFLFSVPGTVTLTPSEPSLPVVSGELEAPVDFTLIALDPTTLILSGYSSTKLLFNFFGESLIGFDMGTPFGPTSFDRNFPAIANLPLRLKGEPTFFFIEGVSSDVTLQSYYSAPEPSTWAMMALGFGGIGFVAFRKRGKLAAI